MSARHSSPVVQLRLILFTSLISSLTSLSWNDNVVLCASQSTPQAEDSQLGSENAIDNDVRHIDCGTMATNISKIILKNPHFPEPTYTKTICETVIERTNSTIRKLNIKFKQLELYRPAFDGRCAHDRFAIYTDLNAAVSPVVCGNQTGKNMSIPFAEPQTSLIVSVATSDLDHDRLWIVEIEQE